MNNAIPLKKRLYVIFVLSLFAFSAFSCKKDDPKADHLEQSVTLDQVSATLQIGDQLIITPTFDAGTAPRRTYQWTSDNPEIVDIAVDASNYVATITAKGAGDAIVSLLSTDDVLLAWCEIKVAEVYVDDGIVKILTIGNSFSEDAVENYLYELAHAKGHQVVIGNLYIAGASLSQHWQNAGNNATAYEYRKIDQQGSKTNTPSISIAMALADEDWDYISFQQASPYSGQYSTFESTLPSLLAYVQTRTLNPHVKYTLHQTWAYAQNSTHTGFAYYDNDQLKMYNAIVDAYQSSTNLIEADVLVPSGTAIQNARTSFIGDNLTRDGYHLSLGLGRFVAACTWFETIFESDVTENSYKPTSISDLEAELAKQAAHFAVLKPEEITEMVDYQAGDGGILTKPVYIDFGGNTSSAGWNSTSGFLAGTVIPNLTDADGDATGIVLTITERFNAINTDGATASTTDFNMPQGVSSNSYYGNSKASFGGFLVEQSTIKLTGLNKDSDYNLCFFGSRMYLGAGDGRETKYIVSGSNSVTSYLETSNNDTNIACSSNVRPTADGEITITVTAGENNTNATGFYYLGAMRIAPAN